MVGVEQMERLYVKASLIFSESARLRDGEFPVSTDVEVLIAS